MKVSEFDFNLPESLIAQHPEDQRDHSRLMVINRKTQAIEHKHFYDIVNELTDQDVLILNNTKVIPARLMGLKTETQAVIEVLLLKEIKKDTWEALTKPAKRVKVGTVIDFNGLLKATCVSVKEEGIRIFEFSYDGIFIELLEQLGTMPLPPYIHEKLEDQNRYQTVYAKNLGSAAAPTAGLHFTKDLLDVIKAKGVEMIPVTLNVGLGTFRPVQVDDIKDHHMHKETYTITQDSANRLNEAKKSGKRLICVGTTSIRTVESNYQDGFHAGTFETGIFIYPGYTFKACDALITNFHLPKSTLLMLVSAFANQELIKNAYQMAVEKSYRFFSFGDAMFIK
ncbi:MAG: tRNA preQ1(34) S-adenosylmethionine ribosyltransferase-isomerase QueA [Acholeplasmataceae bacterium]